MGFFNNLEKRIEALRGHHVGLVQDENLEAISGGGKHRTLAQISSIVNTVVAIGINLNNVQRSRAAPCQLSTDWALPAGSVCWNLGAVQTARQNPGAGSLAATPGTREKIRVVDAVSFEGSTQRVRHLGLTKQLGKGFRVVAAVDGWGHPANLIKL